MRADGFMNVIDFGTRKITYNLHHEDRKRLRIVVAPDLIVDVFAPAKLIGRFLWVWVEDKNDSRRVRKKVDIWYRKRAHETLGRYMARCHAIASRHDVPESELMIRIMYRRWESCSPKGRIILNLNLVKAPVHCIEYVIMHELCHLKYHNHSRFFYSLLTRCQPDWHKRKAILDKTVI